MRTFFFVTGAALLALTSFAWADDRPGEAPQKAPPGGFLLSDLVQLGSASLMQEPPKPAAPTTPPAPPAPPSLWTIGGWAEVAYTWNFGRPTNTIDVGTGTKENGFRIFDVNHNEFMLHQVALNAEKAATSDSPIGFHVLAFAGQDAKWVHAAGLFDRPPNPAATPGVAPNGGGEDFDVLDAYMTFKIPPSLFPLDTTITLGKWETVHGAEVIRSPDNLNYSRSYLFGFAIPFTHTGIKMDTVLFERPGTKDELLGMGLGVTNGWDNVKDNNDSKNYMAQIRFSPADVFETHAEIMVGPEQTGNNHDWRGLLDINATIKPMAFVKDLDGLSISGNVDYGWEDAASVGPGALGGHFAKWYGIAGYGRYAFPGVLKRWFVGFRGEWFDDPQSARTGVVSGGGTENGIRFIELTPTLGYQPWDSLLVRLEYRYDKSDHRVFPDASKLQNFENTVALDLVVKY